MSDPDVHSTSGSQRVGTIFVLRLTSLAINPTVTGQLTDMPTCGLHNLWMPPAPAVVHVVLIA